MQNYVKTLISALKTWTNKRLVESKADWSQVDEEADNYIKNKPIEETEDDAMEMLAEMGLVDPVMDEENNILTDEDGNIFTIE